MAKQTVCDYCDRVITIGGQVPFGEPLNISSRVAVPPPLDSPEHVGIRDVQLSIVLGGWNQKPRDPAPDLCGDCFRQILQGAEYRGRA